MRITVLDAATLGDDISMDIFSQFGEVTVLQSTSQEEVADHVKGAEVLLLNKVKLNRANLAKASDLRLICVAATGFDNIDLEFCRERGIAVCNVVGYSTQSVAQVTVAMALSLLTHLPEYERVVKSGAYTARGIPNCLTPTYHEIAGKTWGIIGFGNIGGQDRSEPLRVRWAVTFLSISAPRLRAGNAWIWKGFAASVTSFPSILL